MAKLDKIVILGIRNFSPALDDAQVIKFNSPITLFLGQNGSGKTTIMESIQYACTGELPQGSSSGQGFINDPKMSNSSTTKGQIRLSIVNSRNETLTVIRIMAVTQKQQKLQFSTLSATIKIKKGDAEAEAITGRCVDVNAVCCQFLNASPALLNNVIFCHQENSSWPLDEGKKLKEKFDHIFESEIYNRSVESIRKLIKLKDKKLAVLVAERDGKRELKNVVEKSKRILEGKQDKWKSLEIEATSKQEELTPLNEKLSKIRELEYVLVDLQKDLATKKETEKGIIEQRQNVLKYIQSEFEGTDQELKNEIESFSKDKMKLDQTLEQLNQKLKDIDEKTKIVSGHIQKLQVQMGTYSSEKIQNEDRCTKLSKLIELATVQLKLQFDSNDPKIAINKMRENLELSQKTFNKLVEAREQKEKNLQKDIDEVRTKHLNIKHTVDSNNAEIKECERKIGENEAEINNCESVNQLLSDLSGKMNSIDKTLNNLTETIKQNDIEANIEQAKRDIQTKENILEHLEGEYRMLQENNVTEEKIHSEKQLIIEKQRQINLLKNKHSDKLKQLFSTNIPEDNLKEAVINIQNKEALMVKNLNEKIVKKQEQVTTLQIKYSNHLEKVNKCEMELKKKQSEIFTLCRNDNFDNVLMNSLRKKEQLQREQGHYSSAKIIYETFLKDFEGEKPCCPVCHTDFVGKKRLTQEIVNSLKAKIEVIPSELSQVENDLKNEQDVYDKLQQLKPINGDISKLNIELPQLKEEAEQLSKNVEEENEELINLKMEVKIPEQIGNVCSKLISDVALLDLYNSDVKKSKRNIELFNNQLIKVASYRTRLETEAEIDSVKGDIADLRKNIETLTLKLNRHNERCQQLIKDRTALRERQISLQESSQNRTLLEKMNCDLNEKITCLRCDVLEFTSSLNLLQAELENATKNRDDVIKENKKMILEERNALDLNKKIVDDIERVQKDIDVYLGKKIDQQLNATTNDLENMKNKEQKLEEAKKNVFEFIGNKKEELSQYEIKYRNYQDNLSLRELKTREKAVNKEIDKLNKEIGDYNYSNVADEKKTLLRKVQLLEGQLRQIEGQREELSSSIDDMKADLDRPENKGAYKAYMLKLYQHKVVELMRNDLNKYCNVLEKAILRFHKARMVEINKFIKEYWRATYTGNDIDHIEIKAEETTGGARKRAYDYKVVQVNKGVELEMRGRCSAGQRVLACLIIRLALAETLSSNCGILALDEPTTNLDKNNIESLSEMLGKLVERSANRNFQLLVITHDEEFLNMLTRVHDCNSYYKVSRNPDGFSNVEMEYL